MNNKPKKILFIIITLILFCAFYVLNYFNLIPKKYYSNDYFGINTYISSIDYDNDKIDDQTDILQSARMYVNTRPKYMSKYYSTGYSNDEYGVCTDVIAQSFVGAGYDLMSLVNKDILANRDKYNIDIVDKNIDFRRVLNLKNFFDNNAISLTTNLKEIEEWQGGDIVVFEKHIAIVSDKRNKKGIPYIIHNAGQPVYEEDAMKRYEIIGHYRWN
jgi:uncharacterized protein YijF (DUF1287 family)